MRRYHVYVALISAIPTAASVALILAAATFVSLPAAVGAGIGLVAGEFSAALFAIRRKGLRQWLVNQT